MKVQILQCCSSVLNQIVKKCPSWEHIVYHFLVAVYMYLNRKVKLVMLVGFYEHCPLPKTVLFIFVCHCSFSLSWWNDGMELIQKKIVLNSSFLGMDQ